MKSQTEKPALNKHYLTHVQQPTKSRRLEVAERCSSHQADQAPLSTSPCCEHLCTQLVEPQHHKLTNNIITEIICKYKTELLQASSLQCKQKINDITQKLAHVLCIEFLIVNT